MKKFDQITIALAILTVFCCVLFVIFPPPPNPEMVEFSTWALGDDWESVERRDIPAHWNELHGDLFELHIDDDLRKGNKRMYEAWIKHKLK